jgi:hypothetical protein
MAKYWGFSKMASMEPAIDIKAALSLEDSVLPPRASSNPPFSWSQKSAEI